MKVTFLFTYFILPYYCCLFELRLYSSETLPINCLKGVFPLITLLCKVLFVWMVVFDFPAKATKSLLSHYLHPLVSCVPLL